MVFVSRFGVSLSLCLFLSSHPSPHTHDLLLCPPPFATSSSPWCVARCVRTAGWRWMMPFATSSWTSPVFHPGWLGRATSSRQSSTKLSPPKRSITRAKVLCKLKRDTDIKFSSYRCNINRVFCFFQGVLLNIVLVMNEKFVIKWQELMKEKALSSLVIATVFVQNFFPTKIKWDYLDTSTLFWKFHYH